MLDHTENNLLLLFKKVRTRTKDLIINLYPEDTVIQTESFVSPTKWHLAHTSWFFENFILKENSNSYKIFDKNYNYLFNSYYNSVGSYNNKTKRGFVSRPFLEDIINYRDYVDRYIEDFFSNNNNLLNHKFALQLGINHEEQHQELILMDILNVFFNNPLKPNFSNNQIIIKNERIKDEWKNFSKTTLKYGFNGGGFCYDNETPSGETALTDFQIQTNLVSNEDWKDFISNDGYNRHEFWLSDGWDYIKQNKIERPLYWIDDQYNFTLNGLSKIKNNQPVSHISFYEADAYARYRKKRLPTEFELELCLLKSEKQGNFLENTIYEPIGGKDQNNFFGDLWTWTSSNYTPYKNYQPFGEKFAEYNGKFMCNQFVLKGGSCITPIDHIRSSYRNFYYPGDRWQFSGLRLANDI